MYIVYRQDGRKQDPQREINSGGSRKLFILYFLCILHCFFYIYHFIWYISVGFIVRFLFLFACQIFNMHFNQNKKQGPLELASKQEVAILKYTQRPSENPNINYNFRWRPHNTAYPSASNDIKKNPDNICAKCVQLFDFFSVGRWYPCCCSFWPLTSQFPWSR